MFVLKSLNMVKVLIKLRNEARSPLEQPTWKARIYIVKIVLFTPELC